MSRIDLTGLSSYYSDIMATQAQTAQSQKLQQTVSGDYSNATGEELMEACLTRLGVAQHFSFLLSCEQVGAGKNRPDVFWEAARRLGAPAEDIAVYEDALYAADTAKQAGFYTIAIWDDSNQSQWETLTALADEAIPDWQEAAQTL